MGLGPSIDKTGADCAVARFWSDENMGQVRPQDHHFSCSDVFVHDGTNCAASDFRSIQHSVFHRLGDWLVRLRRRAAVRSSGRNLILAMPTEARARRSTRQAH